MITLLYETVPKYTDLWVECLGEGPLTYLRSHLLIYVEY